MRDTCYRDNHQERQERRTAVDAPRRPTGTSSAPVPFNSLTGAQQRLVLELLRAHEAAAQGATGSAAQ